MDSSISSDQLRYTEEEPIKPHYNANQPIQMNPNLNTIPQSLSEANLLLANCHFEGVLAANAAATAATGSVSAPFSMPAIGTTNIPNLQLESSSGSGSFESPFDSSSNIHPPELIETYSTDSSYSLSRVMELKDSARVFVEQHDFRSAIKVYNECLSEISHTKRMLPLMNNSSILNPQTNNSSQSGSASHLSNTPPQKRQQELLQQQQQQQHLVNSQPKPAQKIPSEIGELEVVLHCNLSLCHYNLSEFEASLSHARSAGELNQYDLKATYRRAIALKKLGQLDKAFEEITHARFVALAEQKLDEKISNEYRLIKQLYAEAKQVSLADSLVVRATTTKSAEEKGVVAAGKSKKISSISQKGKVSLNRKFAQFKANLDAIFECSVTKTPLFAVTSAVFTYFLLTKHMRITNRAILATSAPTLAVSFFGILQAKPIVVKTICGALVFTILSVLNHIRKPSP